MPLPCPFSRNDCKHWWWKWQGKTKQDGKHCTHHGMPYGKTSCDNYMIGLAQRRLRRRIMLMRAAMKDFSPFESSCARAWNGPCSILWIITVFFNIVFGFFLASLSKYNSSCVWILCFFSFTNVVTPAISLLGIDLPGVVPHLVVELFFFPLLTRCHVAGTHMYHMKDRSLPLLPLVCLQRAALPISVNTAKYCIF